jgi:altronate dehydratase small subunit
MPLDALMLHKDDNVATAVRPLEADDNITVHAGGDIIKVRLLQSIPFGHKFALKDIGRGDRIVKYGETIGLATASIRPGEHVHLHNVEGQRGRGDRQ